MRLMPIVIALCVVVVSKPANAQANPDSVKLRNDCRLAAQVLRTGNPAPHLEWARVTIRSCEFDQWADAAASAIRRARGSTDARELAAEWRFLWMVRDAVLFDAVRGIASDHTASLPSRLWALRTLATYIDPEGIYGALTEAVSGGSGGRPACISNRAAGITASFDGRPLAPDFADQARRTARTIMEDESELPVLRSAALCVQAAPVYGVSTRTAND
jgi:hypothetical protein